ncbi:glycosyltransferase family 50 protein [Collybiopsis luxurians FD-317 M1]|uniref:GPI mannosyltransferase 1 n=1 Tax=Collybiopsis luxurians FD-317 M1 TaxID=944289 RepID=A0A0D0CQD7_9AGAR|nr:glycosyltransferase family 50 protein [Collybiopsis luxurians FD-317 M1]
MFTTSTSIINAFSFRNVLLLSVFIRVGLILYSEWHDARSLVKYTDVDYRVFTDAAQFLLHPGPGNKNRAQGPFGGGYGDPYSRETYRYTPLLALVVSPNDWLHPSFGKYLFAACDILNGILIYALLLSPSTGILPKSSPSPSRNRSATLYAALHLLNPMVFSISTRGSSEAILSSLVLLTLYAALRGRWNWAAVMLGVCVHWKIYPAIYGFACIGALASPHTSRGGDRGFGWVKRYLNRRVCSFGLVSVSTFGLLTGACYLVWGYPFLYESYLYHLHRLDHRHNFSPYFYLTYLTYPSNTNSTAPILLSSTSASSISTWWTNLLESPLTSFVPQMTLAIGTGLVFGTLPKTHLPFTWFIQTVLFVVFNKVCTSQYFLWYLLLLPLILPRISMSTSKAATCVAVWVGVQALWLSEAYRLEFLGSNVFYGLWLRGLIYVIGNCWVVAQLMQGYDYDGVHGRSKTQRNA